MAGLAHYAGLTNASGPWYLWWSGIAGDLPMLGIFVVLYRKHNCQRQGCWRVQWRKHGDALYCRKHHPDGDR